MGKLILKPEQDGSGYFYGEYRTDTGDTIRVDVLPPRSHPRPPFVMSNDTMHASHWIVYADGNEVARVTRREDVETLDITKLLTSD